VTLALDFGKGTYDLRIQKTDVNGRVPAGVAHTLLILSINDRYSV
jgi:hypothetical protein